MGIAVVPAARNATGPRVTSGLDLPNPMARISQFTLILSALWFAGVLAGIGLFLRALRFVELMPAVGYSEALIWALPALLMAVWLAVALLWYRRARRPLPLGALVLSTLPIVPVAVLGILLQPPINVGTGILLEIGGISRNLRGGTVAIGAIVALLVYLHALILGAAYRFGKEKQSLGAALAGSAQSLLPTIVVGALLIVGVTQAVTYISIAFDDQVRYWSVADALARGQGYPLRTFDPEFASAPGEIPYWTDDLPIWPLAMVVGFAIFGHTTAATYAPLIVANALLPLVAFLAVRNVSQNLILAFGAAVTLVLFPMYQVYSLGAAEPEPLFHLLLLAIVASVPRSQSGRLWVLCGIAVGLMVVTRPEGGIYAAVTMAVLVALRWREPGVWIAGVVAAMPTLAYAGVTWLQTGLPWPLHRSTYFGLENLQEHWIGFSTVGAEYYGEQLRTTTSGFWLILVLALVLFTCGSVWLFLQRPVFLFIPLGAAAHIFLLWLTDAGPALSNVDNPPDFFRHMSHALPYAWITACLGIFALSAYVRQHWRQKLLVLVFMLGTYYCYQVLITPEVTYGRADILLPASKVRSLLRSDTYVMAQDILAHPFTLPEIEHSWQDGVLFADAWDYLGFRANVFAHYRPFDMHRADVGKPYMMASFYAGLFAYLTFALAALGGVVKRPETTKRRKLPQLANPSG